MKIVGIVSKHMTKNNLISIEVSRALMEQGLLTIGILPPNEKVEYDAYPCRRHLLPWGQQLLEKQMEMVDGIVFQGGDRIGDYEYDIARFAYANDIPTLGICAGQSAIANALGADIVDVDPKEHRVLAEKYVHSCEVVPGTRFASIVKKPIIQVNSRHKRAVKRCDQLVVSGVDPDGNAEVLEAPNKRFFMGVRFHPESLYREDPEMLAIFEAFAHAVKGR